MDFASVVNISQKSYQDNVHPKYFDFDLIWKGQGINEKAYDKKNNKLIIKIDKKFFRPTEVNYLFGNTKKANQILKWKPKTSLEDLIKIMCEYELKNYENS